MDPTMTLARRHIAHWLLAVGAMTFLLANAACGGTAVLSTEYGDDANFGQCTPLPCPSNLGWDPVTCACDVSGDDAGIPVEIEDATATCAALRCPSGFVTERLSTGCACIHPVPPSEDATTEEIDASVSDAPTTSYEDVYTYDVSDYDGGCGFIYDCGNGYSQNSNCQCVRCDDTCPAGESPGDNCVGCIACPYKCPVGLVSGPDCSCVPPGTTTTGPVDAGDGGGPTCEIAGYLQCAAGSWCALGTCPDNKTQFGCYCDASGHSTCQLECPTPPPCTIPGEGTCPYGSQCAFGSCSSASDTQLVCSCYQNGQAYCSTTSCEAGAFVGPDSGSGSGVTCLLEGYLTCNAGSFCSVATCPDGTTQVGCFCNADGTATCQVDCPPPPPCVIPGEGTCPFGSQCTFGTCNGSSGTLLSCSCNYGSTSASCYTYPCSQASFDGGGGAD
jgi:hypothetical protein